MSSAPNPWPVPDAAVDAACREFYTEWGVDLMEQTRTEYRAEMRAAILAALPHLGIAELLGAAAYAASECEKYLNHEGDLADRLRDAAVRMKGEA